MEAVREDRNKEIIRFNIIAIAVNLVLATAKITVGSIVHSAAVTLDGVNSMADMISSALILVFARLSDKKADKDHPFGFGRLEYLCSMIVTTLVLGIGIKSVIDAIREILYPGEAPNFSFLVVAVEVVSMIVKFFIGKAQQDVGKRLNSQAMIMAGIDAMSDVGIGAAVLVSIVIYKAFGIDIEDYLCVIIAALIIKAGVEMLIESMNKIVGAPADPDFRKKITTMLFKEKDVY
ncbi:MAG: cation transporter, partial [Erysipelotrichaceae bacterium]|nr:cation transporter [Erysipelotrichaceae bacterium]